MIQSPTRPLTVYAAGPGRLMKTLVHQFEQDTGIGIKLFQATTGRVLARLEAEAANPQADVFISASWDLARELRQRDWLLPYQSPNAGTVPEHLKTDCYVAQAVSALGIVWHRHSQTPQPQDWLDLADPAFAHRVTMPDPTLSGASVDLLAGLERALGEQAWQLLAQLRDNGLAVSGPNDQALASVVRGNKAAAFGSVDYVAYHQIAQGAPLQVIFPRSGTVMVPRPMMILKQTRQPALACKLIDYLLSEVGQRCAAEAWLMPARNDVSARRPTVNDVPLLPVGANPETDRERTLERFQALILPG